MDQKMKAINYFYVILLFTFASTLNVSTCFALQSRVSPWKLTIFNYREGEPLTVHCKSKDDNLGI